MRLRRGRARTAMLDRCCGERRIGTFAVSNFVGCAHAIPVWRNHDVRHQFTLAQNILGLLVRCGCLIEVCQIEKLLRHVPAQ